jgi:hypothetical protein
MEINLTLNGQQSGRVLFSRQRAFQHPVDGQTFIQIGPYDG